VVRRDHLAGGGLEGRCRLGGHGMLLVKLVSTIGRS
jgi:hypothetical protein